MQPTIELLKQYARQAGEILRAHYGGNLQIEHKGLIDLVTEADKESEALIISNIQCDFPGHSIVAEESGRTQGNE